MRFSEYRVLLEEYNGLFLFLKSIHLCFGEDARQLYK